jgi:hypothetical protein
MATHTWNGHAIEVQSYATPRLLWFSIAFLVHVDAAASFRSPSHLEGFRTIVPFQILEAGTVRHGRVESTRPFSVLRGGCRFPWATFSVAVGAYPGRRVVNYHE